MDWKNIIYSLEQRGLNRVEIARKCNCSLSLINALAQGKRGSRLSYDIGSCLVTLNTRTRRKAA